MHSGLGRLIVVTLALVGMSWVAASAVAAKKKTPKTPDQAADDKDKDDAAFEKTTVDLGEPATQVRTGGGGRFLIFHLKKAGKLAIVDVTKGAVVHSIEVADDVRYAASQEKLLIVLPAQKLVHRYNLTEFQRERTAPLADDAPTFAAVMGCSSNGPLVLRGEQGHDYSAGKLQFWDIEKMAASPLPHDIIGGGEIRVSADGRSLTGWTTGISSQTFELARLRGDTVEKLRSPDAHTFNKWWATPTADGSYVLRYDAGIYSKDLKPIPSDAFAGRVLLPCEDPRLMLAAYVGDRIVTRGKNGPPSDVAIVTLNDQQVLFTLKTPELQSKAMIHTERGYFSGEPRVHYLPALKALVTFPESNDKLIVRKFDIIEALKQRGGDYLFVVSKPPAEVGAGEAFSYRPQVLTNGKSVKFKLESGPEGMVVAEDGLATWPVKGRPASGAVKVVISVSADNGKEAFHAFSLGIAASGAVAGKSGPQPNAVVQQPTAPTSRAASAPGATAAAKSPAVASPAPVQSIAGRPTEPARPEASELIAVGKFRLAGSRAELSVIAGNDGQSLLVLQQNRLSILGSDGITIRKQVKLPTKYTHLAEREKYYVGLAAEPRSIDLIDKATLAVKKSFKLPGMGATDLALHPTKPVAYVSYKAGIEIPRYRFIAYNEESGDARESEHCIGNWLQVSPDGAFLIAGYSDIYESGQQLVINPDNMFFVPEYGSIDWLIRYDLKDPERPAAVEKKVKAGGNGGGLRMSPDGKRVTYLSHVGYPEFSGNLAGWDPTDLHKLPVSYATKDIATTLELAYHPLLPIVASVSKTTAVIFDREHGDLQPDRVKLLDDDQLSGNIRRIYFTPDGRHLLFEAVVNDIHYLVQAELKLTPAELKQINNRPAPAKHDPPSFNKTT